MAALIGAVGTALVWSALAGITGLIFHFMPAGPTLASAWIGRSAGSEIYGRTQRLLVLAIGASISVATTLLLAAQGRALDDAPLTVGVVVLGVAAGARLLRLDPGSAPASDVAHHTADDGSHTYG